MALPVNATHAMPPAPAVTPSENLMMDMPAGVQATNDSMPPTRDPAKVAALGALLASNFKTYENARRLQEMKWARNLRQFLGEYDPEFATLMNKDRSQAYPRITRVKCVSMVARLMNLLFPTSEKNWGISASPVPNLEVDDLNLVLQQAGQQAQQSGKQLTTDDIEQAVWNFAVGRASNLEREIEDQLAEVGGNRSLNYVALCRKVLMSGVMYSAGVLKGPFTREQKQRRWVPTVNGWVAEEFDAYRPQFEFVPVWDYYPDMTAKQFQQMDGQFQRMVLSKSQLRELADNKAFMGDVIMKVLADMPGGNYKEKQHETELRTIGVHTNAINVGNTRKFEILIWDGFCGCDYLEACGLMMPDSAGDMCDASIWMIDNIVIRADISPWVELEPEQRVQLYHHFVFEEDDSSLLGNGLPNIMRDSQMAISNASRMLLDNASVVCGPNLEVNTDLMEAGADMQSIQAYKVWKRTGVGQEAQWPAVRELNINSHLPELQKVVEMFMQFADAETFVNPATGGDMQKGPSEPFRTAAGASMIQGQAALPFKDVVRNFDSFTMSVINSLILFNKHFNDKPSVQGDFTPIARGSSSLIAKEVRGMALDQMAQTLQPEERPYMRWHKMLQERLAVRDVDITTCVVTEDEAAQIDQANQQRAESHQQYMEELLRAEVRKLLADAVKSLTQADANTLRGEAAVYQSVLAGLEKGVTPTEVHAVRAGASLPPDVAQRIQRASGNGPEDAGATESGSGKGSSSSSAE